MNKFDCIKAFITIVEQGSIINAARELNQTNAAISKKLSKLEGQLGVRLAIRNQKLLHLTEIGTQYYEECKILLTKFDETERLMRSYKAEPCGALNVVSNRYFADTRIIPKLPAFMKRYPKIELNLNLIERLPDFTEKDVDITFGTSLPAPNDVVEKKIGETRYLLCASPTYLKHNGTPATPRDLSQYEFITHSHRKPSNKITLDNDQEINVRSILRVSDTYGMCIAATHGIGIIWIRDYLVEEFISTKKLVTIMDDYTKDILPLYLYYPQHRTTEPKVTAFVSFFS